MQVHALSIPNPDISCELDDTECDPPVAENCGVIHVPDEECDFGDTPEPQECAFNLEFCPDIDPMGCPTDVDYIRANCDPMGCPTDVDYIFPYCVPASIPALDATDSDSGGDFGGDSGDTGDTGGISDSGGDFGGDSSGDFGGGSGGGGGDDCIEDDICLEQN
jgi:hypothetical protein